MLSKDWWAESSALGRAKSLFGFMHVGASGDICEATQVKATILTMVDTGTKMAGAVQVQKKGRDESGVRYVSSFLNNLAEAEVVIRTDNEPGLVDMVNFIAEQRRPRKTSWPRSALARSRRSASWLSRWPRGCPGAELTAAWLLSGKLRALRPRPESSPYFASNSVLNSAPTGP